MKINFHKSDLLSINMEEEEVNCFAHIFCWKNSNFPMKYLGVPLHYNKLNKEDLQPVVDKLMKRIAGCKRKLLSFGVD